MFVRRRFGRINDVANFPDWLWSHAWRWPRHMAASV